MVLDLPAADPLDTSTGPPPLTLPPEEMRRLGYRVVDLLVDRTCGLPAAPVSQVLSRADADARLWEPLPEHGTDPDAVLDQLQHDVLPAVSSTDHPRFFAFIPSPSNFVGVLADALASGSNAFLGSWLTASGPTTVELLTVDWLRQICGFPEPAGGLFTSGGSASNLMALAVARHVRLGDRMEGAVVYTSDQTHSSVHRAMAVLGFRPEQLRVVPSDDATRLDLGRLRDAVAADRAAGRRPFCVVANAGTTNTGTVDPLDGVAAVCQREHLWMHVDGAYGAAAMLSARGRERLRGLSLADSVTLDPHKWFFQPYEAGVLLVRDRRWLRRTFQTGGEYLADAHRLDEGEVNLGGYGMQLSRNFRALKLWLSLKVFGVAAFREAVDHGLDLAETAERLVRAMPDWEVVLPARLGIATFRYAPPGLAAADLDALHRRVAVRLRESGYAMASTTEIGGRVVLRLCTINPRTTRADVRTTLDLLDAYARFEAAEGGAGA